MKDRDMRNKELYSDPTAAQAIFNVSREENKKRRQEKFRKKNKQEEKHVRERVC